MLYSATVYITALGLTSFSAAAPLSGLAGAVAGLVETAEVLPRREDVDDPLAESLGKGRLPFGSGSGGSKRDIESSVAGQLSGAAGPLDEGSQ
ncbi:hypothetical protein BDV30DRAFT_234665 [Aspergillus minisclerotigenes]|uniref:Uncharacterized protein n=1 Tax=Aspergillus minisclerotigenes TaxID=656917 RepID=A0A5N6JGB0_9EURO|nr:hypothetical protein BDV30DRAFT_234665 [Aspergillus minisclerotigenes]